jgi:hypothetical protein
MALTWSRATPGGYSLTVAPLREIRKQLEASTQILGEGVAESIEVALHHSASDPMKHGGSAGIISIAALD